MDVEEVDNMNASSFSSISNDNEDMNETSASLRLSPLRMSPIGVSPILVISDDEASMSGFSVQSMRLHSPLYGYGSNLDDDLPQTSSGRYNRRQSTSAPSRSYFAEETNDSAREEVGWEDNNEDIIQEPDQQINLPESPIDPAPPEPENDDIISDDGENDTENWSNSLSNHLRQSANQLFDTQHGESLDSEEHLFAPDEASELDRNVSPSSSNTPGLVSILRNMPSSSSSYQFNNSNEGSSSLLQQLPSTSRFNYLNSSGIIPITSRYSVLRTGNRLLPRSTLRNRFSSSPFRLTSESNASGSGDSPLNLTQRRSRLLNLRNRTRSTYEHLFLRNRLHNAPETTNNPVSFSGENETNDDLPPRPRRRRRFFTDDFEVDSLNGNSSQNSHPTYRSSLRFNRTNSIEQRTSSFLRSIVDLNNQLDTIRASTSLPPLTVNCGRARSVSPTTASPWIANSVDDDSLDDTSVDVREHSRDRVSRVSARAELIGFVQDSQGAQIERPNTPLPPPISDDESPTTPTPSSTNNEAFILSNSAPSFSNLDAQPFSITVSSSANTGRTENAPSAAVRAARDLKEIPQTYEDLNYELIQLLECPICFEYSTPPINQCLQGHIICSNCRQRVNSCPTCRNMFQESRNLIMEKVAALLRYPCKNAMTGCLETLFLLQKEQHEQSCGFRHYVCFIPMCNWRGYKPELLVHVQEAHENHVIHGSSVNLLIPITGQTKKVWLMSAFNELFYVIFFATLGILKGCVRFIGDSSKSENYTYTISVTSEEEMMRNLNYTRTTHAYEENAENIDILDSYDLFSISYPSLSTFRRGTRAPVRVTVEEARPRNST
ncbi:uncharacterized protein LOC135836639 isoform X2 [Planococcus citri]|uniref:uncharacterized protein LOC135836639 isoform X2 n=1 Tax=Planococcus citri TaxID=170843 RepID=UPI0031F80A35